MPDCNQSSPTELAVKQYTETRGYIRQDSCLPVTVESGNVIEPSFFFILQTCSVHSAKTVEIASRHFCEEAKGGATTAERVQPE